MTLTVRLPAHAEETIHRFLRAHALSDGLDGVIVGLSGGIDSALCARLACDALGAGHVTGVLSPDRAFPPELLEETLGYARDLGIETRVAAIDPMVEALQTTLPELRDRVDVGNAKARIRMIVVHALARPRHRLVMGTGNKSELLLGYFTKYGDGGVDLLPIGDLYKTEIRELASRLGMPMAILERPPTAGLWEGQTDEGELGMPYASLDRILLGTERLLGPEEIADETGIPLPDVRAVLSRVDVNRHKRRTPPIPKIGLRTIGLDWRD